MSFVVVTLFIFTVSSTFIYTGFQKIIEKHAVRYTSDLVQTCIDSIDSYIKDIHKMIIVSMNDDYFLDLVTRINDMDRFNAYEQLQLSRSMENYLRTYKNNKEYVFNAHFFDRSNKHFTLYSYLPFKDKTHIKVNTPSAQQYYVLPKELYEEQPPYDYLNRFLLGSYIRDLKDYRTDTVIGRMIIDIKYSMVEQFMKSGKLMTRGSMLIIDDKDNIVYQPDQWKSQGYLTQELKKLNLNEPSGVIIGRVQDKKYLIVYKVAPFTGWRFINLTLYDDLMREMNIYKRLSYLLFIGLLVVSLLLSNMLSINVTKSIKKLVTHIDTMDQNLDMPITLEEQDEIGYIANAFNRLAIRIKQLIEKIYEEEHKKKEIEFAMLQTQITPHFLYNTLNSVKVLARIQKIKNIESMIASLMKLLRISLGKSEELIKIEDEIQYIKEYQNIIGYQYHDAYELRFEVDEKCMQYYTLKLLLQPIVENAIYHGIDMADGKGLIIIRLYQNQDRIVLEVEDNGKGMTKEKIVELFTESKVAHKGFSSIGIKNVQQIIQLHFGEKYGLFYESDMGMGTKATIIIPKIEERVKVSHV